MTEKTEYSTTFIAYFCGVAALLREAVRQADAAVEFESELLKINAAAENALSCLLSMINLMGFMISGTDWKSSMSLLKPLRNVMALSLITAPARTDPCIGTKRN